MAKSDCCVTESSARGQKIRTETGPYREKAVTGPGHKADMTMLSSGGMSDLSASVSGNKVKRIP
jgi:hypothetical protein